MLINHSNPYIQSTTVLCDIEVLQTLIFDGYYIVNANLSESSQTINHVQYINHVQTIIKINGTLIQIGIRNVDSHVLRRVTTIL